MTDNDHTARLAKLDTCAVSDTLDSLSLPAAVTGLQRLSSDKKITGKVITVKLAAGKPVGGSKRHLCTGAIAAAESGNVIVIQQTTGINAAGWGGVLSQGASLAGIAGVIVDGPARDIDEARSIQFPVYARNATSRTARSRIYEKDFNCPITIADVDVSPGDYVIADSSGIAFIPALRIEDILKTAEHIAEKERLMVNDLRDGKPITEVMGTNYETMLD